MAFELQWKPFLYGDAHKRRVARFEVPGQNARVLITHYQRPERYDLHYFIGPSVTARSVDTLLEVVACLMECGLWPSD